MAEVHEQEGEVVEGVDRGQRRVELEAVEQHRAAVQLHDVAEMQVAVAVADEARAPPLLEQLALALEQGAGALVQLLDQGGLEDPAGERSEVQGIAVDHLAHAGMAALVRSAPGLLVEPGDLGGERIDRCDRQLAALCDPVEQRRLVEAAHLEQPLDRPAAAFERVAAVLGPVHADKAAIEHGRGPAIELELGLEGAAPLGRTGKIEKAVADRALHLVGALADQEDHRRVRRDALDLGIRQAVGRALAQGVDQRVPGVWRGPGRQRPIPQWAISTGRS